MNGGKNKKQRERESIINGNYLNCGKCTSIRFEVFIRSMYFSIKKETGMEKVTLY